MLRSSFIFFGKSAEKAKLKYAKTSHPRVFTLDAPSPTSNGTVALVGWLYSKPKNISKYAEIYLKHNIDVVFVTPTWSHVMNPPRCLELMRAMEKEVEARTARSAPNGSKFMWHNFSMGAYCGSMLTEDLRERKSPLLDRFVLQCYDSPVDYDNVPHGVALATFNNPVAQRVLEKSIHGFLNLNSKVKAAHIRSSQNFWHKPLIVPSCWFYSSSDVISPASVCEKVMDTWKEESGVDSHRVHFEDTKHVTHYKYHPDQYKEELEAQIQKYVFPKK